MTEQQPATSKRSASPSSTDPTSKRLAPDSTHKKTIDDLPEELLDHILGYFHIHCDSLASNRLDTLRQWQHTKLPTLQSLLLVSKRWQRIAEPHLYRAFYNNGSQWRTQIFISTLIARPHLANQLDIIYLDRWKCKEETSEISDEDEWEYEDESDEAKGFPARGVLWRTAANHVTGVDDHQLGTDFILAIDDGDLSANMWFLLALATEVTVLDIDFWIDPGDQWLSQGMSRASAVEGPLHKLRRMALGYRECERIIDTMFLPPVFRLPSLREVEAWDIEGKGPDTLDWPVGTSDVTDIALCDSVVHVQELRPILASVKILKSFTYRLALFWELVPFPELYEIIFPYCHSLEHLCLDLREHDEFFGEFPAVMPLRHFTKLRRLEISQCLLIPPCTQEDAAGSETLLEGPAEYQRRAEDLPPSLEHLSVFSFFKYEYSRDIIRFLRLLPAECLASTPRLREVDLRETSARGISTKDFVNLARVTRTMFEEVNVRLSFQERLVTPRQGEIVGEI